MVNSLEHREDGSIALWINADLQFDSKDEHIYHETLTAPALSITKAEQTKCSQCTYYWRRGWISRQRII